MCQAIPMPDQSAAVPARVGERGPELSGASSATDAGSLDSLEARALEELLRWLARSDVPSGEPVPLRDMAQQLGMSRTPVRMAVGRLEERGLLTNHPRLGFRVAGPTASEIADLFDARLMMERHAIGSYVDQLVDEPTASIASRLTGIAEQMSLLAADLPAHNDLYPQFRTLDQEFHRHLLTQGGNPRIASMYDQLHLNIHITRFGWKAEWSPARFTVAVTEHAGILQAIQDRDKELALERATRHISRVRDVVLQRAGLRVARG